MQVLNDKDSEPKRDNDRDAFAILSHALFGAVGIASIILGPLPMILAQIRLQQPWPRVVALAGAVIALTLLGASVFPVLLVFIFGLYISDNINDGKSFWWLMLRSLILAAVIGGGLVFVLAQGSRTTVGSFWSGLVDSLVANVRNVVRIEPEDRWKDLRTMLFYEGPFMYLSLAVLSLWLSVGTAAHLGWFGEGHSLSGASLRKLRLPLWLIVGFVLMSVLEFLGLVHDKAMLVGVNRVLGSIVFVQGCVYLSEILSMKNLRPRMRTFVYALSIGVGFYVVIVMGIVGSWVLRSHMALAAQRKGP